MVTIKTRILLSESTILPSNPYNCTSDCAFPQPSPAPTPYSSPQWDATTSVDILIAALFLIAAGWLVLAIFYSVLFLCVVRMRSRGELDVYERNFGRLYLCGGCFVPLGCILRHFIMILQRRSETVYLMTREERRRAMEELLVSATSIAGQGNTGRTPINEDQHEEEDPKVASTRFTNEFENDDAQSNGEPICSICLMEYDENDPCFTSPACLHRFHHDCVMDWLERRNHTECPCCREAMVADDDVWDAVQRTRRQERKLKRRQATTSLFGLCFSGQRSNADEDNDADGDAEEGRPPRESNVYDLTIEHNDAPLGEAPSPLLPVNAAHAGETEVGLEIRSVAKSLSDEERSNI